jgi:hypothetical protein
MSTKPSDNIPTYQDYILGKTKIQEDAKTKILSAPREDKNISNQKLSSLTTLIQGEMNRLSQLCNAKSTLTREDKTVCEGKISIHNSNLQEFATLHRRLLTSMTPRGGSKRKTRGQSKNSKKSHKHRKNNRNNTKHNRRR